jgi:hypothetical protein
MFKYRNSLVFIALLLSFTSSNFFAQPGIKGGLSVSALQSSNEEYRPFLGYEVAWVQHGTSNPILGLQLGVFYRIKLSNSFSLQPELYFSQRGYKFDQIQLYNTSYRLNINYLEVPILFEYKIPVDWSFRPGIIIGPFIALKLNSNKKIKIGDEEVSGAISSINDFDYGVLLALGTELDGLGGSITLDLRLNWGLSNMMSQPNEYISISDDPGNVQTRAITLMVGYRFNIDW